MRSAKRPPPGAARPAPRVLGTAGEHGCAPGTHPRSRLRHERLPHSRTQPSSAHLAIVAFPRTAGLLPAPPGGMGGGDILNPSTPVFPSAPAVAARRLPPSRPQRVGAECSGAVPRPASRCRCHTPRASPADRPGRGGQRGGAPTGRFTARDPRSPAEGNAERLPLQSVAPPPPPRPEPAAGEARCLDASPRLQHRLSQRRTVPSSCPVNGCRLTDRRSGHTGRQLPGVHL